MKKSDYIFLLFAFFVWRVSIIIFAFIAIRHIPLSSQNFLGGGYSNYKNNPLLWGNLNFDGEHYLSIAQSGYHSLTYFFFPLFPLIVRLSGQSQETMALVWRGLIITNISFILSLIGLFKLIKMDFNQRVAKLTITLLLAFPTSFYFGIYYTESLFLCLTVWSFYFISKKTLLSSITASLASSARVIGISLFIPMLIEYLLNHKPKPCPRLARDIIMISLISPLGLLSYMYFLLKNTSDPLIFVHEISIFGNQRSSRLVILPQVIYRYLFKILPTISNSSPPLIFTSYLEFATGIIFLAAIIYGFFRLKISYSIYSLIAYIIPTLSGSFSSFPRYALELFPCFVLFALILGKFQNLHKYLIISALITTLAVSTALFWRGYWIS